MNSIEDFLLAFYEWPLALTENSERKIIRMVGVLGFYAWFLPATVLIIVVGAPIGVIWNIVNA